MSNENTYRDSNCKPDEIHQNADYIHNSSTPAHCCDNDKCECHHPLRLWAIKYEVTGVAKFSGVAVVQAKDLCNAQYVFIQNSKFNGFREYIHILCIEELYPNPEPVLLLEDSAAIIDRHNLKSYPFLLKSDYDSNIQNISDNVIEAVEDYIEHNPIQQVQSNWNETDATSKAYILNKPTIPDAQVQSDWNETNVNSKAYIQNKPEIPDAQVQANWEENDTTSKAYIQNKPSIPAEQVQVNWEENDTSSKAFILNKPTIPEEQVNADWNSESGKSQILNKPTDLVKTSDIEGLLKNDGTVYTGKHLEQVQDLDNFQASEGKIVQYIGATNSKYTHGYVYKKVGTQTIIPVGTEYIDVNDNTGCLASLGINKGRYYLIEDENDPVASKIRIYCTRLKRNNVECGWVPMHDDKQVYLNDFGFVDNELVRISSVEYYSQTTTIKTITFANGKTLTLGSSIGDDNLESRNAISIYENIYGERIYSRKLYGYNVLTLEYIESEDVYQSIASPEEIAFHESYNYASEQIIIGTIEWQQLDVQPREDTSHYITDSDIGWIEH